MRIEHFIAELKSKFDFNFFSYDVSRFPISNAKVFLASNVADF